MEHINITRLGNGNLYLIPLAGYKLHNTITDKYYTEAVVKSTNGWEAVRDEDIPIPELTDEDEISDAEALKIIRGL